MANDGAILYDQLWDEFRASLPGAIEGQLELMFSEVLYEFFRDSLIWREMLYSPLMPGQPTYVMGENLAGARVQWVLDDIWRDNVRIRPMVHHDVALVEAGASLGYSIDKSSHVTLHPTPEFPVTETHVLAARCVLVLPPGQIAKTSCGAIPTHLLRTWYDAILWGVQGRMMTQLGKPYSNAQQGLYYRRGFRMKVAEARDIADRGNKNASAPWRFPSFA